MGIANLILLSIGLGMDACAVSICKGLKMKTIDCRYTVLIALFFGGFQGMMPLIGWALGKQFAKYIENVDHWIAFVLLLIIGIKMISEAFQKEQDSCPISYDIKELFILAVATSIDALAVGVSFAFLKTNILLAVSLIGVITFILSLLGVAVGNRFGIRYKSKAELLGGVILIAIGVKILMEHI